MRRKRLLWRLFFSLLGLSLASIIALCWFASRAVDEEHQQALFDRLELTSRFAAQQLPATLSPEHYDDVAAILEPIGRTAGTRLTVVLPDGRVLADTRDDARTMENHSDREEIKEALTGRVHASIRYSSTLALRQAYVAVPIKSRQGRITAVVRASVPAADQVRAVRRAQGAIFAFGLAVAGCVAMVALWLARRITRPIEHLAKGAQRYARGDLGEKLPHSDLEDELSDIVESLNQMAGQIEERGHTIGRQGHEQEAVLASMVEGVLAVDSDERVISLNRAAIALVGSNHVALAGRRLQEVIRNGDLRDVVKRALESDEPIEDDVTLRGESDKILRVRGTALRDARGESVGAVIVLNDVTRFRHLENVRRDFVANVSHELKTPITSIKGFVETLLDGAMANPEDATRFLRIVVKQADRLNSIIEDLLSLSKIEQSEEAADLPLAEGQIQDVLASALYQCKSTADDRKITLALACDERVIAQINPPLLEQAIINLIDNAIKYSEPGKEVRVLGRHAGTEVTISVSDNGCGIEKEHLPRLFERFYRVDKARSRKLGGTGLGLAIVKHIVQAHHGRITVASTPGKGSVFTIALPGSGETGNLGVSGD